MLFQDRSIDRSSAHWERTEAKERPLLPSAYPDRASSTVDAVAGRAEVVGAAGADDAGSDDDDIDVRERAPWAVDLLAAEVGKP